MQLDEARNDAIVLFGLFIDFLQQFHAIHRMNHRNKWGDKLDFIGLKMSDEVPSNIVW